MACLCREARPIGDAMAREEQILHTFRARRPSPEQQGDERRPYRDKINRRFGRGRERQHRGRSPRSKPHRGDQKRDRERQRSAERPRRPCNNETRIGEHIQTRKRPTRRKRRTFQYLPTNIKVLRSDGLYQIMRSVPPHRKTHTRQRLL